MRKRQVSAAWRDSALETGGFEDFDFECLPRHKTKWLPYVIVVVLFAVVTFSAQTYNILQHTRSSLSSTRHFDQDDICKLSVDVPYMPYVYFRDSAYVRPNILECGGSVLVVDEICASGKSIRARRCKSIYVEHVDEMIFFRKKRSLVEGTHAICLQHWIEVMAKRICD